MRVSNFDDAKKIGTSFEIAVTTLDQLRFHKKKITIQHSYKNKEMPPTIHRRTQVDDRYDYPAASVSVSSDSYLSTLITSKLPPKHKKSAPLFNVISTPTIQLIYSRQPNKIIIDAGCWTLAITRWVLHKSTGAPCPSSSAWRRPSPAGPLWSARCRFRSLPR